MLLSELIKKIKVVEVRGNINIQVKGLSQKIDLVKKGDLFFCYKGVNNNGHDFAYKAKQNGAVALIVEKFVEVDLPQILVKNTRKIMPVVCNIFFYDVLKYLYLIGVTGTNGKTTSTTIIYDLLNTNGYKVGLIGTNGIKFLNRKINSNLTTPDTVELFYIFSKMKNAGVKYVVMEVSAHAIALNKLLGIKFEVGALTNISQDHLDFFKNMTTYAKCKLKFLNKNYCKNIFINVDDKKGQLFSKIINTNTITYGLENPSKCFAIDIKYNLESTTFLANVFDDVLIVKSRLSCKFNVYNLLLAISIVKFIGLDKNQILNGIKNLSIVNGRMNLYKLKSGAVAIIDFAHTPDGLKNVLENLREINKNNKITTIFGCGGNRDKLKRSKMGNIASTLSDKVILTSDNPRNENPLKIINDIKKGINKNNYLIVENRIAAIEKVINDYFS